MKKGSCMEVFSSLDIAAKTAGLDAANKKLLKHREILAIILKGTVEEYQNYSLEEIVDFIEADSILSPEVSRSRTNTLVCGEPTEFKEIENYIDFSGNKELVKEVSGMGGLGESILEEGREQGREQGVRILIEVYMEMGLDRNTTYEKVKEKFELDEEKAEQYMERYWKE